ncbi:MAG: Beta-hexosaminidase [Candidatus Ordinivivax streblomastigis]|uniref:beta-N-acetylhexosaminidase n=1 Tax=Candidatus Ordinivivax streblomastigis TaxID=2540710 RepID=A0A5M8NYL3_9BACT|nr:MAG: Beta-hexosaminidase [Candidatus Ordinivivax streblomastigis]
MKKFRPKINRLTCLVLVAVLLSCTAFAADDLRYGIIPKPLSLKEAVGEFKLTNQTAIAAPAGNARLIEIAEDFAAQLRKTSGLKVKAGSKQTTGSIVFRETDGFAEGEYTLSVTPQQIVITASTSTGIYYGVQSVCQLLPAAVYGETKSSKNKWVVPCCEIRDAPRFPYRGIMLDAGRYFMPKELVLKVINIMAMHKQNMFHWHLTEDQGWRIEIKKYPKLTEIGSVRKESPVGHTKEGDGTVHGGFYTQEDVKEIVEYARKRCVTVIPEIELPGHSTAAIAAYPELSCFPDSKYEVATTWGVKEDVYCPSATTFRFLEDVFTELFELFPSPYYHIGGDECPRDRWKESPYCQDLMKILGLENEDQLQIFFMQRITKFIKEKGGKTLIGWDEILDGGAVPGAIVMSYRGHAPGMRASHQGIYTVMAANRWNYLDNTQDDPEDALSINEFMPLDKVYKYHPVSDTMPSVRQKYVLGQQGCLWTEYVPTPRKAESMAYPRAVAMSEVAWCNRDNKDWDSFRQRMLKEFERLDILDVNYSQAFYEVIFRFNKCLPFPKNTALSIDYPDAVIRYTSDGSAPTVKSPVYSDSIRVAKGDIIRAQGFLNNGKKVGKMVEKKF